MSTIKTTYIQHPSATSPNLELAADGTVVLPLSDLEDLANVSGSPTDGQVLSYDNGTSTWNPTDPSGGFDSSTTITATDSSWSVPASADGIFRVTVIGGGGGGGAGQTNNGATGGTSSFVASGVNVTASGGLGGTRGTTNGTGSTGSAGLASGNGGEGAVWGAAASDYRTGQPGQGGRITIAYVDLSLVSTVNVTVGAGGAGGAAGAVAGGAGGRGEVIVEYRSA